MHSGYKCRRPHMILNFCIFLFVIYMCLHVFISVFFLKIKTIPVSLILTLLSVYYSLVYCATLIWNFCDFDFCTFCFIFLAMSLFFYLERKPKQFWKEKWLYFPYMQRNYYSKKPSWNSNTVSGCYLFFAHVYIITYSNFYH